MKIGKETNFVSGYDKQTGQTSCCPAKFFMPEIIKAVSFSLAFRTAESMDSWLGLCYDHIRETMWSNAGKKNNTRR